MSQPAGTRVRVREATFDDAVAVREVGMRNGLSGGPEPGGDGAHARASFAERWTEFPDRDRFAGIPIGWVLEDGEGRCVGTLTNYHGTYRLGDATLTAAIAGGWAVDPAFRGPPALMLMGRHLGQRGVDLLIDSTASREAGAVLEAMKARRVPHPAYDEQCYWVADHRSFARSALRRMRVPALPLLPEALAAGLAARDALRVPARLTRGGTGVETCDGFDPRFDRFWEALCRRRPGRLLAVRSSAMLAWHFRPHLATRKIAVLAEPGHHGLAGYAVLVFEDGPRADPPRAQLADLQVLEDDRAVVDRLLAAAFASTRERGLPMLQAIGFEPFKRAAILGLAPYRRKLTSWLYYYKAVRQDLAAPLEAEAAWDPSPYDGDATL
jgi:hypothetical protein